MPFSLAYSHLNGPVSKFAPKAVPCVMLGNDSRRSCYRLLRLSDMTVIFSRDVICNENVFPFRKSNSDSSVYDSLFPVPRQDPEVPYPPEPLQAPPIPSALDQPHLVKFSPGAKSLGFDPLPTVPSAGPRRSERLKKLSWKEPVASTPESTLHVSPLDVPALHLPLASRVGATEFDHLPARQASDVALADEFRDFIESCFQLSGQETSLDDHPRNFGEAMARPDARLWRDACEKEMRSHIEKHNTLVVAIVPRHSRVTPTGWCFKRKQNSHSGDYSYKARLVVRGNRMTPPEFGETFAPVARWVSLRTLLAIATQFNFFTESDDVETAFLMAEMDTEVFVSIPQGFAHLFKPPQPPSAAEKLACRLLKGIPGIKQGSRLFWKKLERDLKSLGFAPTLTDPCIFFLFEEEEKLFIGLWVDDLVHVFSSSSILARVRSQLRSMGYVLVSKPNLEWHLGVRICRDLTTHSTTLDMEAMITKAASKFGFGSLLPAYTPAPPGVMLDKPVGPPSKHSSLQFRSVAATALYISVVGRPDIAYAVNCVCRWMDSWDDSHAAYLLHIWRYLLATKQRRLRYTACPASTWLLVGFSDSSWADVLSDRTSTMGFAFFLGSCLVAWSSKKQRSVALPAGKVFFSRIFFPTLGFLDRVLHLT